MSDEKPTVSLETSFISYLCSNPSRDILVAGHQQVTSFWWENRKKDFHVLISDHVLAEISEGDNAQTERRLHLVSELDVLKQSDEVLITAESIVDKGLLPSKAKIDAIHISYASINELDYLLTWNCKHIANVELRKKIEVCLYTLGYSVPSICTPLEMIGELDYGK